MRIGLISDIHGNLPALEAVLGQLAKESVDRYICLGDVAVGPWASETVKRVRELGADSVIGNWDAWVLDGVSPCGDTEAGRMLLEMGSCWAGQLDDGDLAYMRRATPELSVEVDGRSLVFFHGSPRSYNEPILAATPTEELTHMLAGHTAPVVAVGHTHVQMARRLPFTIVVNPGSVGMPFVEWPAAAVRICPWAEYGIVEYRNEGDFTVELRRTRYDADSVIRHTRASGVPHAEWWTSCWNS